MVWGMPILRATLNTFANYVPGATFIPESRVNRDISPHDLGIIYNDFHCPTTVLGKTFS